MTARSVLNGLFLAIACLAATPARATPTDVIVRVISEDGKFVGDTMGGAEVVLRDAGTGSVLARGVTQGTTGDTQRIMQASGRTARRATDGAAAFRTTIDIARPTLVRVEIKGPLGSPDIMRRAMSERWLVPGQPVGDNDGWVLELPGLAVRFANPGTDYAAGRSARLVAEVQLMCGCPITLGGIWDAAEYDVRAIVQTADSEPTEIPLAFLGPAGQFGADWIPARRGTAIVTIVARNRRTGNTGVIEKALDVH